MKIKFFRRTFISLLVIIFWFILIVGALLYGFITTTTGARIIVSCLLQSYMPLSQINYGQFNGTVQKGMLIKEVEIKNVIGLKNATINIQEVQLQLPIVFFKDFTAKITNGRITIPSSDPVVFNLKFNNDLIEGNVFSKSVDVKEILLSLGYDPLARDIKGFLSKVDLTIDGLMQEPHLKGNLIVDNFYYKESLLKDGFTRADLTIMALGENPLMKGTLIMDSASFNLNKKINIDITPTQVEFKGPATNPELNIHGTTKVDDLTIDMAIKGTLLKPELKLNSDPPLSEGDILAALIRRGWSSIGAEQSQTIGVRKNIGEALNVGMKIEENPNKIGQTKAPGYAQTIEGQYNVTDKVSLNLSQKYSSPREEVGAGNTPNQTNKKQETEFTVQYKKRF